MNFQSYYFSSVEIKDLNNTIGLFYQKEKELKITSDVWKLVVYKDIDQLERTYEHNVQILNTLTTVLLKDEHDENIRFRTFSLTLKPHLDILKAISNKIENMLAEIKFETIRVKRGIANGIGTVWKFITGNLDASDGEYFNKCIDKLEKDDSEIQNLIRNQIKVTTSTIRNFNETIRKLQIDEHTFNEDMKIIEDEIKTLFGSQKYFEHQLKLMNNCEQLLESFTLISEELVDIVNSLTFAKLKVIHPSIIKPRNLLSELIDINRHLTGNNLPFKPTLENLPQLLNLFKLQAFQTQNRLIFIIIIPLTNSETYDLYHLYSVPTKDPSTNLFHTIIPESKMIALARDKRTYIKINDLNTCQEMDDRTAMCQDLVPLDSVQGPCEVALITTLQSSDKCSPLIMNVVNHNIQYIGKNQWLLVLPTRLAITYTCPDQGTTTKLLEGNKLITLQSRCNAYTGIYQLFAKEERSSNYTEENFIPQIPFDCCEQQNPGQEIHLKPLKINQFNLDDLNVAAHKLGELEEELDNLHQEPFASWYLNASTIWTLTIFIMLVIAFICCKCGCCRRFIGYAKSSPSNNPRPDDKGCCAKIYNFCTINPRPQRRTSLHQWNIELQPTLELQTENSPLASASESNTTPRSARHQRKAL